MADSSTIGAINADKLSAALDAVAPHLTSFDHVDWCDALQSSLDQGDINTPRRIAAFLGQVAVESQGFTHLEENLNYSAPREMQVWPSRFPNLSTAQQYAGNPEKLADYVYAGKLGNGDVASGDGWRFRGKGLEMLTGRSNVSRFAGAMGMTPDDASDYLSTMAGACDSAVWFWNDRQCSPLADAWSLSAITLKVNGAAMLANDQRVAFSNAALKALS